MDMRGQAMIVDALFFLMICGMAAATLLWAGSVYGNKSFEAHRYIYMTDYASGCLQTLSNLEHEFTPGRVDPWTSELGAYMTGEFNTSSNPGRYERLYTKWESLCERAPAPMLLKIYSESDGVVTGGPGNPIYWSCGKFLDADWVEPETGRVLSLNESVETEEGTTEYRIMEFKYTYYSSPLLSKACGIIRCEMQIKIYY